MSDELIIGGKTLRNRFFLGTGKFPDNEALRSVLTECGIDVVTVALRRVDPRKGQENILDFIPERCVLLPNTSGARNADEAVRIARLAKASGCSNWIKIEVISDNRYLLPDNRETVKATEILAKEGFVVLPYMLPDLYAARDMVNAGAAAVMPLGSPIGSNRGLRTTELIRIMINEMTVPVIVDAGIGRPSDAAQAMELGCSAVLVNTAVAIARRPAEMARACALAVKAGRLGYLSGIGPSAEAARASSPLTGFVR
jgi:thiazole synthase